MAAFLAVAAAIAATLVNSGHTGITPADRAPKVLQQDPLARELARCRAIGMAAKDDAACTAAWAENRRRFFAPFVNHASAAKSSSAKPDPEAK